MQASSQSASPSGFSDRAFFIDVAAILAVSIAILLAADQLVFMSLWVPAVFIIRFVAFARLPGSERPWSTSKEVALILVCALIGGFNDWNSVVNHRIYDYGVPVDLPAISTIPTWMLLFWGLILRSLFTLYRWGRLSPEAAPRNKVYLGKVFDSPYLVVIVQLLLIVATRQAIYRMYLDPLWSWLPFAAALLVWAIVLRPGRHAFTVLGIMLIIGPITEALYIEIGGLHQYHLGVFFGVPVWIMLWWALATVIWGNLAFRVARRLAPALW